LIADPEVLILDEPTVGLDPKQILEMRDLIKELSKKHTILLSSHIMQEVSAVCNQIMIINNGCLVVSDRPEEIPKHIEQKNELTLLVKGNKELITSVLESLENIEKVSVSPTGDEEINKVELESSLENDVREEVFFALADVKCAILEMNNKVPTLEEAFIRLTGNGSVQAASKQSRKRKRKEEK
jgi:ABC-2 type transport system ATP-binding protein